MAFKTPHKDPLNMDPEPLNPAALRLSFSKRDSACRKCSLFEYGAHTCLWGNGPVPCKGMIVGQSVTGPDDRAERPLMGSAGVYLDSVLREAEVDRGDIYTTLAVKCYLPYSADGRDNKLKVAQKECADYLEAEIEAVRPHAVLAMGASAYYFFTHAAGVVKHRGQAQWDPKRNLWLVPTIHPDFVLNNPAWHPAFLSDVRKFVRLMDDIVTQPKVNVIEIHTIEDFRRMMSELEAIDAMTTFDLETRGFKDFIRGWSKVWCAAITRGTRTEGMIDSYLVPMEHPDSPFHVAPELMREVVQGVCGLILRSSRSNGHNVKFDLRNLYSLATHYADATDDEISEWSRRVVSGEEWPVVQKTKVSRRRKTKAELQEEIQEAENAKQLALMGDVEELPF